MVWSESGHSGVGDLVRMGLGLECRLFGTLPLNKSVNIKMEMSQAVLGKLGHMSPGLIKVLELRNNVPSRARAL